MRMNVYRDGERMSGDRESLPSAARPADAPRPGKLTLLAGMTLVSLNRALLKMRLRRRLDGWRRGAGLVLRGEPAMFYLSAFGLDTGGGKASASTSLDKLQQQFGRQLSEFLAAETEFHLCIRRTIDEDPVERCPGSSYTLRFEEWIDGPARFVRPELWVASQEPSQDSRLGKTDVLFNFVARVHSDGRADLWLRINHIGTDGVPAQALLTRLEAKWGRREQTQFPTPASFAPYRLPRSCGRDGVIEMQDFLDLFPLLKWRTAQNKRLPEPITLSAAMLWCLGRHAAFSNLYLGTTVEIPPIGGLGSGVGVVVVRPTDYFLKQNGLASYVRDFNQQLNLTRRRASAGCKTLDAAAHLPAKLATALLRFALEDGRAAFGSVGLTMLRDAKVFGAPLGDAGHVNGFIAIGNVALDAGDGQKVACITIKGPAGKIERYPEIIRQALDHL
jgi:hypothetical protein